MDGPKDEAQEPLQNGDKSRENSVILYPQRWWVLCAVAILQFANYGHWVAFGSVTKSIAKYYDQPGDDIDLIILVSYVVSIPLCLIAAFVVETFGLRFCINLGGALTGLGNLRSLCIL